MARLLDVNVYSEAEIDEEIINMFSDKKKNRVVTKRAAPTASKERKKMNIVPEEVAAERKARRKAYQNAWNEKKRKEKRGEKGLNEKKSRVAKQKARTSHSRFTKTETYTPAPELFSKEANEFLKLT